MNRAEQIWNNWEEKQKRLEALQGLGREAAEAIRLHRYDYLRHGLYRLSRNSSPDEKIFAQVIRTATAQMRRRLYPNPFVRALVGVKEFLWDRPRHISRFEREREKSLSFLKQQLREKGISPSLKPEKLLDTEAEVVRQELGAQLKGKRMYLDMTFQNNSEGRFLLEQYTVSLVQNGNGYSRTIDFPADSDITVNDAVKLLEGRAIRKPFEDMDGKIGYRWLQADLADTNGTMKIMEFPPDYQFDLKNVLTQFSRDAGVAGLAAETVIATLEAGDQIKFEAGDQQVYYLHANVAENTIALTDRGGRAVDVDRFLDRTREQSHERETARQFVLNRATEKNWSAEIAKGI